MTPWLHDGRGTGAALARGRSIPALLWRLRLLFLLLAAPLSAQQLPGPPEYHRFRFFIHPDLAGRLSSADLKSRLDLYVEDLNTIFAKQTIRRFAFDPEQDITITEDAPHTGYLFGPAPVSGFEIWAVVLPADLPGAGSYGGHIDFDVSGAGVADGLHWDAIYDRSSLAGAAASSRSLIEYWKQLHHLTHEIEHIFGAGIGEYYNLRQVSDTTGQAPRLDISYLDFSVTEDSYWSRHPDFWADPLLTWLPQLTYFQLMSRVRFAEVTAAILNAPARENWLLTVPDFTRTEARVTDEETGAPIPFARVKVWKVNSSAPYQSFLFYDGMTDETGVARFAWDAQPDNSQMTLLAKAYPSDGQPPASAWFSIFDAQEQKMVFGAASPVIELPVPSASGAAPQLLLAAEQRSVVEGDSVSLHAAVTGASPLTFRWQFNGQEIAVTTNAILPLTHARLSDAGLYSVTVENARGSVSGGVATLAVAPYDSILRFLDVKGAGSASLDLPGGIAFDPQGNLLWAASFQGEGEMAGSPIAGVAGGSTLAIAKFDPAGSLLWLKEFGSRNSGVSAIGVAADAADHLFVTGTFTGRISFGGIALSSAGSEDVFLARLGPDGSVLWAKRLGGTDLEQAGGVAADASGNSVIVGSFVGPATVEGEALSGSAGSSQAFIARFDAAGNLLWARQSSEAEEAEGVKTALDAAGNIYVTGSFGGTLRLGSARLAVSEGRSAFLAKLDGDGNTVWAVRTPGRNNGNAVATDPVGQVYLTGQNDAGDLFLSRYSASGGVIWTASGGGLSNDTGNALLVDREGNILVGGGFLSSPGVFGDFSVSNRGLEDVIAVKFDNAGKVLQALSAGGPEYDNITAMAESPSGVIHAVGTFEGAARFGDFNLESAGGQDLFLARLGVLKRLALPVITSAPASLIVPAGAEARLAVTVESAAPVFYQWEKDAQPIAGETNAALVFASARLSDGGEYLVIVANEAGSVQSAAARLRVAPPVALSIQLEANRAAVVISIPTFEGLSYELEYTDSLGSAGAWQSVAHLAGTGGPVTSTQPLPASGSRWFRAREIY